MGSKAEFLDITVKWRISFLVTQALSEGCQVFSEMKRAETITSLINRRWAYPDVLECNGYKYRKGRQTQKWAENTEAFKKGSLHEASNGNRLMKFNLSQKPHKFPSMLFSFHFAYIPRLPLTDINLLNTYYTRGRLSEEKSQIWKGSSPPLKI